MNQTQIIENVNKIFYYYHKYGASDYIGEPVTQIEHMTQGAMFAEQDGKRPEIVILEGWCVGARAEKSVFLKKPINILEKYEDKDLIWRKFVNEKLKKEYKKVFSMIDHHIFMKAPNFKMVFKWRLLQEKKLRRKLKMRLRNMSMKHMNCCIKPMKVLCNLNTELQLLMILKSELPKF